MSFPISLVCGRRLRKPALTSSMSHLRPRPTGHGRHRDLSGTLAAKFGQLSDDAIKRLRGVELVGAATP
jgi:hypothetical protein